MKYTVMDGLCLGYPTVAYSKPTQANRFLKRFVSYTCRHTAIDTWHKITKKSPVAS